MAMLWNFWLTSAPLRTTWGAQQTHKIIEKQLGNMLVNLYFQLHETLKNVQN